MKTYHGFSSKHEPGRLALIHYFFNAPLSLAWRAGLTGCLLLGLPLTTTAAEAERTSAQGSVSFLQPPAGARVITMTLSALDGPGGRSPGYLAQRSPEPAAETTALPTAIKEAYAGKECFAFDIAVLADGTRYVAVLNEDKSIKFLNRNEPSFFYARIYRIPSGGQSSPEVVREGFQSPGNDVMVPVEMELPGIGANHLKKLRTEVGYSFSGMNNGKPMVYTGRGAALQVSGSQVVQEGKLTLTVSVPEELKVTSDTQANLRFEPVTPGLPERVASGKLADYLTLGSVRLVITGVAPDFSQASLAVVSGSLEETLQQQLQLGTQMPPFSQVDLVTRRTITREEVLGKAKRAAPVIFIFGDLPTPRSPYGPSYGMGPGMPGSLPLPPAEVADQLGLEMNPKPVVVFVTRQIGMDFLYGDLRNKTPEYLVLTDFADPLRTTFRAPQSGPGGYYGPAYSTSREPTLRQLFNLPERTLSVAGFDASGKVVYVKADAGNDFLVSLAETRDACKKRH